MALKLISSEEAAKILGVSAEKLTEMRQQQKIFGYRDGSNWKFKEQDIVRLAEELKQQPADEAPADEDSGEIMDLPLALDEDEGAEVVLLSEHELGESEPSTSSTIIGRPGSQSAEESDIRIITDEDRENEAAAGSSGVRLVASQDPTKPDSDVKLVAEETAGPPLADDDDSEMLLNVTQSGDEGGSDISLADDALELSLDDDLQLDFDDPSKSGGHALSDSSVKLGAEREGRDSGSSDITLSAADSGISLGSLSDSGLSLEEPLDLAGAGEDESLELGADDMLSLADDSDSAEVREIQVDDDFLLTPLEEMADEESSGSQVIALDSDSDFSDAALGQDDGGMGPMLEEDDAVIEDFEAAPAAGAGLAGAGAATATAPAGVVTAARGEPPYTALNVLSLGLCAFLLALTGMMMVDLLRNMWSWDTPYAINSSIMDFVLGFFES